MPGSAQPGQHGSPGPRLAAKLGIRPGYRVGLIHPPRGFRRRLGKLPPGATFVGPRARDLDLIHLFTQTRAQLEREFVAASRRISLNGMVWVSWPKQASAIPTDLSKSIVRAVGLGNGMVDVKVAAVDSDWSALKFVYRLTDRPHLDKR